MSGLFFRRIGFHCASTRVRLLHISPARKILNIESEDDFNNKVIRSEIPVIVDFHATWCGPCRMLAPLLDNVLSQRKGILELAKVDIDVLPDLALEYKVSAVPAVVAMKNGKVVGEFVGLRDIHFLEQFADDVVNNYFELKRMRGLAILLTELAEVMEASLECMYLASPTWRYRLHAWIILECAFPTPLESGRLPSWALSIIISAVFISLLWFAALAALIVFEVRRRRRNYLWVPTTPSPPPTTANKYTSQSSHSDLSYLSSHLPPPISPHQSDDHTHSSFTAGSGNEKKQQLPSYHDIDVPQLDPFEEVEEREFNLRLHRGASFNSMASSAAGEMPITEKKVPQAISFSKQHSQDEATPTNPTAFTRLDTPDSSRSSGRSSGRSSDSSALSGMVLSRPVTLRQLGATIREPSYLEGEFKKLPNPVFTADDMPKGTERKNRYSNVLPTPKTRVHLSLLPGRPNSDYINANHIRGYQGTPRQYIATQGPMESTVEDFWRMIWENNTDTIVMATNFTERGIDKCSRYWPAQGSEGYGDMEVTLLHQTMTDIYSEATLSLRNIAGDEVRTIRHYRLTCWPSQGVPKETKIITNFLREIKMGDSQGPVVVHCSAGVGRTGVLIALDIGLQGILQGQSKMDVLRIVSTLRQDRTGCVQTRDQYRFIHQAMYDVAKELGPQKGLRPLPK